MVLAKVRTGSLGAGEAWLVIAGVPWQVVPVWPQRQMLAAVRAPAAPYRGGNTLRTAYMRAFCAGTRQKALRKYSAIGAHSLFCDHDRNLGNLVNVFTSITEAATKCSLR